MPAYGYRLIGNAKSVASDYIPSLIGIEHNQIGTAGSDTYFEQFDFPEDGFALTSLSLTRWSSYDATPAPQRDPILAAKAGTVGFYITISELTQMLDEFGSEDDFAMLKVLRLSAGV